MKVPLMLPLTIVVSIAIVGIMRVRKKEQDKVERRNRFEDIKLRVVDDVLVEYQTGMVEQQMLLEKTQSVYQALEEEVNLLRTKADKAKGEVDICLGGQKSASDELAAASTRFNDLKAETEKEKTSWKTEVATLEQQLAARSLVCDFLKKGSQIASKFCGEVIVEAPKQEEPKAEAPKQEEPKAEAPKQEEPKAEAPKQEEPKAEAPKQEEPKAEAPKQEEPKAEAPKKR
ncbi:FK506-binding protein 3 isoform X3 [Siniperca chuatsi]|uniref:FK506-binding protein 3 isoform X2 n=1 Tax=Siniperca chuatsi TaxID=119488 RepID=UPI001CE05628|nr:FK506-binding protein 3 isoform X2 [Siniperca chuatsi]XP_044065300.1 FK506-binding protein 3 isoform X3 [Siniperca chuatsi]